MKKTAIILFTALAFMGCSSEQTLSDTSGFGNFVKHYFGKFSSSNLDGEIDLYVDYSTCVAEAKLSAFYQATHPSIVDSSPVYYSIKGSAIKEETRDPQQVYLLLNTIREVNNADIKQAVHQIVTSNHQAVLITDGEYYMNNATHDNLNNPYLAEEFRSWIQAGRDIYIYSEPYVESGRYEKFRYYMFFTDRNIPNNIQERFSRSMPASSDVKMIHLSQGIPACGIVEDGPTLNPALSAIRKEEGGVVLNTVEVSWKDIQTYLSGEDIAYSYFLRGIFVSNEEAGCFKTKMVRPVTYSICREFLDYKSAIAADEAPASVEKWTEVKGVFDIDQNIFHETGEIVLKLASGFDGIGRTLSSDPDCPNLLKIDFIVEEAVDVFSSNDDLNGAFKWYSIAASNNHMLNTSLYQSIHQVLLDPAINPQNCKPVVCSVYLNMCNI